MEDNPQEVPQAEQDGREGPPLIDAPLLTAVAVFIVLPLVTLIVLLLMWLGD